MPSRIRLAWVAVVWRRELGMLVSWTDILDGEIVNAAWAVAGMVAKPRTSRRAAADLDTAAWGDTERLIREALPGIAADLEIVDMSETEAVTLEAALNRHEVQGALQALLAVRLTDAPEVDAARAREAIRLALGGDANPAGTGRRGYQIDAGSKPRKATWKRAGKAQLRFSPASAAPPFMTSQSPKIGRSRHRMPSA
jgi:hypothetical protein